MLLALVCAAPAGAAFPGQNGRIAYHQALDGFSRRAIFAVSATGTAPVQLTDPAPGTFDSAAAWSPDGTRIAFSRLVGDEAPEIYVMNADGSAITQLTSLGDSNTNAPTWSPDGAKIAFHSGANLWVMDADGSDPEPLPVAGGWPSWSPDGMKLAFMAASDIAVVHADGTGFQQLTTDPAFDWRPDWAPDGSRITFQSDRGRPSQRYDVYVMDADGSDQVPITTNDGFERDPVWSPDGSRIAYHGTPLGGPTKLHTVNPDGSGDIELAVGGFEPAWQPLHPGYPRPKAASPVRTSLAPAYIACSAPNRTHGPPLAFGSCSPPQERSAVLTVGTPDANGAGSAMAGHMRYGVQPGDPATPADEADLRIDVIVTDVRCRAANAACPGGPLSDYEGRLAAFASTTRITDRSNLPPGPNGVPGTGNRQFRIPLDCTATASAAVGATCAVSTSADALMPGVIVEGRRAIWELGQINVRDAGPNGTGYGSSACPPDCGDGDETTFLRQGVFVP